MAVFGATEKPPKRKPARHAGDLVFHLDNAMRSAGDLADGLRPGATKRSAVTVAKALRILSRRVRELEAAVDA